MKAMVLKDIVKRFGYVTAVDRVSLEVEAQSFTTLLGPSGCGKTTLLRILAGLEEPDEGYLAIGSRVLVDTARGTFVPARARGMGLVFQSYALWPHMTVFDNVAYGLRVRRLPEAEVQRRVLKILRTVEMAGLEGRYPGELSGGQQQRVSMARMLVIEPEVLLMDEPLSNLDAKLRLNMRAELKRIHKDTGITIIYVTHDQAEAMTLSTHIAVMRDGRVQQFDTPQTVYQRSANLFVADFMGSPSVNLLDAQVTGIDGAPRVRIMNVAELLLAPGSDGGLMPGQEVVVMVRPEDVRVSWEARPNHFPVRVYATLDSGPDLYLSLQQGELRLLARVPRQLAVGMDDEVYIHLPASACNLYDKATGNLIAPTAPGSTVDSAATPEQHTRRGAAY